MNFIIGQDIIPDINVKILTDLDGAVGERNSYFIKMIIIMNIARTEIIIIIMKFIGSMRKPHIIKKIVKIYKIFIKIM